MWAHTIPWRCLNPFWEVPGKGWHFVVLAIESEGYTPQKEYCETWFFVYHCVPRRAPVWSWILRTPLLALRDSSTRLHNRRWRVDLVVNCRCMTASRPKIFRRKVLDPSKGSSKNCQRWCERPWKVWQDTDWVLGVELQCQALLG